MTHSRARKSWSPEGWLHRTFNWRLVRGFGQSAPATLSMAAPFIGYAIIYHSEIASWLGGLGGFLDLQYGAQTCQPLISFPMRLNLLYCGILILGIGTIIYRVFSPIEVKSAKSTSDYVIQNLEIVTARNLRSMYVAISARRPEAVESLIERAPWLDRSKSLKSASDSFVHDTSNQIKIDVLRSYYSVKDRYTYRSAVYVISFLFVFGFILLSIPGLAFSVRVFCSIGHDIGALSLPVE